MNVGVGGGGGGAHLDRKTQHHKRVNQIPVVRPSKNKKKNIIFHKLLKNWHTCLSKSMNDLYGLVIHNSLIQHISYVSISTEKVITSKVLPRSQ